MVDKNGVNQKQPKNLMEMRREGTCGGFFAIDPRSWGRVCELGINEMVAFLTLAAGSGASNASTSWSANALHNYTGITFSRGKQAIDSLVHAGIIRHGDKHTRTRPRYEFVPWKEQTERAFQNLSSYSKLLLSDLDSNRKPKSKNFSVFKDLLAAGLVRYRGFELERMPDGTEVEEPEYIWLPNTVVTGTSCGEQSPVRRLRMIGDKWTLRLFVELYDVHNLRDDGGISPSVLRQSFNKMQIGQRGHFILWAFEPSQLGFSWEPPFCVQRHRAESFEEACSGIHESLRMLQRLGILAFVPHLWENGSPEAEIIHVYGSSDLGGEQIECEIGRACREAAMAMALPQRVEAAEREGYTHIAAVRSNFPDCCLKGVGRLRYRPKTRRTKEWFKGLQLQMDSMVSQFSKCLASE